ncbi:TRAUB-domain-containing protein [Ascobolus immersus RN42]|uniref:Protein BFR2 n=1 Tax=Ascobolus immersus RN42 TaxID=1160509 RepID=A0A3N4IF87_ASCIM|nr:TRAUB-domain-containing protein [Ascobolus immersus RN42]
MAPKGKSTSLKDALALLEDPRPTDFDPEALEDAHMEDANEGESGESGSEAEEGFDGREHYVAVGESKLRKPDPIPLDPKYNGAPVSRSKLGQDDTDDDEEDADSDEEEDDNEGSELAEEDSFDGFDSEGSGSGSEDDKKSESEDEDGSDEDMEGDNDDEGDDDDDSDDGSSEDEEQKKRAELKKMMAEEQKAVVSSVSEAAKQDIAKGNAVRQQQATFDAFLGARIKLQKALVVANSPAEVTAEEPEKTDMDDSIKAAEEAVLGLWSLITDLRHDLADARSDSKDGSLKRKRSEFEAGADLGDMWSEMKKLDAETTTWRNNTLEKWSSKVQGITVVPVAQRLNNTVQQHSVTSQIRETLTDTERLVKRTRIPRSCAPVQASKKVEEDPEVFDDTDFYQLLLKALVDQKLVDSSTGAASSGVRWKAAMREAKKRKNVDTKASKGRKLKYQVHEKLQNFMAPNPNLTWHEEQIDELFSSLLGQRARMDDDSESEAEAIPDDGLRLFGRA